MTDTTTLPPDSPQGGGMTIRVYTVDRYGQVIDDRGTRAVPCAVKPLPVVQDTRFPPCGCPKCGPAVAR
ncbi:hypothetical protein [Streptomyces soliscabiei]|uniref:hypothetical protein n=1 Tax=Streptomyces soliscabiei TaxID=588897 RepID=UPI0029A5EEDC|nr:hypothetical protein [Streptomyces sp. NY05-11A]MDX2677346.1 hypothetical protein [Streptomyces sp. NY05-11A]